MSFIRPYALFIQCFLFPRCCQSLVVFRGWCAGLFLQADKPIQFLRELINRIEYLKGLADWGRYGRGWEARTKRY